VGRSSAALLEQTIESTRRWRHALWWGVHDSKLVPLKVRGKASSVAHISDDWFIACLSKELKKAPVQVIINGTPIVVFRSGEKLGALLDRCPHRNVPLSTGRVKGDRLQCPYHGWEFTTEGHCGHIPCLVDDDADKEARRAPSFAVRELDGFVWVYGEPDSDPLRDPFRFPHSDDKRYAHVDTQMVLEGSIQQIAENALDVPHTAFLHGGIFRNPSKTHLIDVEIYRFAEKCEAHYIGEPSPPGLIGKILAPGGGEISRSKCVFKIRQASVFVWPMNLDDAEGVQAFVGSSMINTQANPRSHYLMRSSLSLHKRLYSRAWQNDRTFFQPS